MSQPDSAAENGRSRSPVARTVSTDIEGLLLLGADEDWAGCIPKFVDQYGLEAVEAWSSTAEHNHKLIHLAEAKSFTKTVQVMGELGFNINVPRASDSCTPRMVEILMELGADVSLKNTYGESCDAKYASYEASCQNIIWLDLELTCGHYDEGQKLILEAAVVVTDKDLNELGRGQWVIAGFSEADLNGLNEFHQRNFRDAETGGKFQPLEGYPGNGLFTEIRNSTTSLEQATKEMLALLKAHCPERACPIAGNSVQCDREVLKVQMPEVYKFLSHQIIDVSSFLGVTYRWMPTTYEAWRDDSKKNANYNHRAINDVDASIQSMRWIRQNLLVQPE